MSCILYRLEFDFYFSGGYSSQEYAKTSSAFNHILNGYLKFTIKNKNKLYFCFLYCKCAQRVGFSLINLIELAEAEI